MGRLLRTIRGPCPTRGPLGASADAKLCSCSFSGNVRQRMTWCSYKDVSPQNKGGVKLADSSVFNRCLSSKIQSASHTVMHRKNHGGKKLNSTMCEKGVSLHHYFIMECEWASTLTSPGSSINPFPSPPVLSFPSLRLAEG
jgi:hypothetical protein